MSASRALQRWNRWTILLLIALNTLLWAPFALSGGHFQASAARAVLRGCPAPPSR